MENVREIVLDTLLALEKDRELSHRLIRSVLDKYDYLESQEKAFIKRVTEGTLERRIELDYYLDVYSSVPVKKMKPLIRNLMRMSVYQILFMDGIPDSAVCNEACKLAQKRKFQNLKGFVNGVLRKIAREKGGLPMPDGGKEPIKYLSVRYSMPTLIVEQLLEEYGKEMTEVILQGLLEIHPVSVRVTDRAYENEDALFERLQAEGTRPCKLGFLDHMYRLEHVEGLGNLQDFQNGNLTVQDVSSVLAVTMAGIKEGDFVIDPCAAPGGKTVLAAALTGPKGKVVSGDVSEKKTEKIYENKLRMGLNNIEIREWDARQTAPELEGKADVVLLDVPCSGLGVMGKKRDIKYHVTKEGLEELLQLQKDIIQGVWKYVKPGGILLYSTCTIRKQENRDMVEWIVKNLPFEPVAIYEELPGPVQEAVGKERLAAKQGTEENVQNACVQLLPGVLDCDGFFFAKLRRK